jgi:hypothetical protein
MIVTVLWIAIAGLYLTAPFRSLWFFNQPQVNLMVSLAFRFGMSLVVAYIAARAFLLSRASSLLLLGTALLAYGLSGVAGNLLGAIGGKTDSVIAINNIGALVASGLFLASGALALAREAYQLKAKYGKGMLLSAYLSAVVFMIVLTVLSLEGNIPAFLTEQGARTQLNHIVLGLTVGLFVLSSAAFLRFYMKSRSRIAYWCFLAIALLGTSSASFLLSFVPGDLISWAGRAATFLGCTYFLLAVMAPDK